jgi:replicative DNA helicase
MARTRESVSLQHKAIVPLIDLPREYREKIEPGISTGWKHLDTFLQGLRKGEVTVITADTGVGKTTFATQLMVNAAMQGAPGWLNSWEMRPEVMIRKLASLILRKNMKLLDFTEQDNKNFDEWCARYPLSINTDTTGTDLAALAKDLHIAKRKGIQIVLLDHLDYLVKYTREKLHEAIEETVKILHELALGLQLHILLICHPRQTATASEEIGIHSLKGSSSIKQYADNVLVLHRCSRTDPQADASKVKVRVAKNRMFGTEGTSFLFYQNWDGYLELKDYS